MTLSSIVEKLAKDRPFLLLGGTFGALAILPSFFLYLPLLILGLVMFWLKITMGNLTNLNDVPNRDKHLGIIIVFVGVVLGWFSSIPCAIFLMLIFLGITTSLFSLSSFKRFFLSAFILTIFGLNQHFYFEFQQILLPISIATSDFLVHLTVAFFSFLNVTIYATPSPNSYLITLHNINQKPISMLFSPPCSGIEGIILYTIVCLLVLPDIFAKRTTKITYGTIGLAGTIVTNIIRILIIVTAGFFFGIDGLILAHKGGYSLFLAWSMIFWYIIFKRTLRRGEGNASQFS